MPSKKLKVKEPKTNAFVISQYFGFNAFDLPPVSKDDREKAATIRKGSEFIDEQLPPVEEKIAILRDTIGEKFKEASRPLMFYSEGQATGGHKKKRRTDKTINLSIIGTPKSIAEAILIKTAQSILHEEGYKDVTIKINSVGGKESLTQFVKEATGHYRKHVNQMSATCRQAFKDGVHSLIACGAELPEESNEDVPQSLSYLTDEDRTHFKEVVEFLEGQDMPYEIDGNILGDPHYSTHTIFQIVDNKTNKVLATGSRLDNLAKRSGYRKGLHATHATLLLPKPKAAKGKGPVLEKSKFYFVQIGPGAKQVSLNLINMLREAKIPVFQSLTRDRLSTQLQIAERKKFPYVIVIGQKEARDGSVVIRDMNKHSQVVKKQSELIAYLRKLK